MHDKIISQKIKYFFVESRFSRCYFLHSKMKSSLHHGFLIFWKCRKSLKTIVYFIIFYYFFFAPKSSCIEFLITMWMKYRKKRDRQIGLNFSDLILQLRLYWISILWNSGKVKVKIVWMFCCEFSNQYLEIV